MNSSEIQFDRDPEFRKLLARREDIDLTLVALEIARDAQPGLDFANSLDWINRRSDEFAKSISFGRSDRHDLKTLVDCLAGTHGLHGDREAFLHAESSFLNRVIETGLGIPLSLSLIYTAVAQRVGMDLVGVAAPMHYLTRLETPREVLFLDPFHAGRVLGYDECLEWLASISELSEDFLEPTLERAAPRETVMRMLNNLKAVYIQQENWHAAWQVQNRLVALAPLAYEQKRDLAVIAIKANHPGTAVDLLEACLKRGVQKDEQMLQQQLLLARRMLADWN